MYIVSQEVSSSWVVTHLADHRDNYIYFGQMRIAMGRNVVHKSRLVDLSLFRLLGPVQTELFSWFVVYMAVVIKSLIHGSTYTHCSS